MDSELIALFTITRLWLYILSFLQYLRKKSGAVSHLSDDEDEAPSPKKEPAPETKTKKKKKKKDKEPKNKEEFIVKLKNIPPNSNRVSHVIAWGEQPSHKFYNNDLSTLHDWEIY